MDDDIETTDANIKKGLAGAMEKDADRITRDDQHIRDSIQPLGRILSEEEQENLNSMGSSLREDVKHLRDTAARLTGAQGWNSPGSVDSGLSRFTFC
jgi:hypothetical protein